MTQNRFYSSVYPPTTLSAAIVSPSATSIQVASTTGEPSSFPYTMLIDWGLPTQEAVSVTAVSGSGPYTMTVTRGIDGTTAQTHINGAVIVHGVSAEDYNEPQVHIATGTSGSSYPNVIHGLANGSSVVGTTDTQTLSNKTLAGATYTGSISLSESSSSGNLLTITNTHSGPTNPNIQLIAQNSSDVELGVGVTGDTYSRFQVGANGGLSWGAGGGATVDTFLYRSAGGVLTTPAAFSATTLTVSQAGSGGEVFQVINSTSAPANPTSILWNNASADPALGIRVTGDTKSRLDLAASGQLKWGAGGSSSSDTNLYRNAAGELKTDNSLTAVANLTVAGTQLLAGGLGVIGVNNATTTPTTTPSGGAVVYSKSGYLKWRGADGLDYNSGHTHAYLSSPFTTASSSAAQNVTGMALALGVATYEIDMLLPYVGAGTIGSTATFAFTFSGTTTMVGMAGQFQTSAYTAPQYISTITTGFTSPTLTATNTFFHLQGLVTASVAGTLQLTITNTTSADETSVLAGAYIKASPVA